MMGQMPIDSDIPSQPLALYTIETALTTIFGFQRYGLDPGGPVPPLLGSRWLIERMKSARPPIETQYVVAGD
jgi:hypothetical protein